MADNWKMMEPQPGRPMESEVSLDEAIERAMEEDGDLCGLSFCGETLSFIQGKTLDVSGCVFERCSFSEVDIERLSFSDCIFDKCELSNVRLTNAVCQRVRFSNCRMTGMEWMRSNLMSTSFEGCMMDYVSLSECKLDRVAFLDCRVRESIWADMKWPRVRFERSDLTRAQWLRSPLAGLDMSTCLIGGWSISLYDLKGVKVTAAQMIELSGLLGVEIVS